MRKFAFVMAAAVLATAASGVTLSDSPLEQMSAELAQIDPTTAIQSGPVPDTMAETETVSQTETEVGTSDGEKKGIFTKVKDGLKTIGTGIKEGVKNHVLPASMGGYPSV